MLRLPFQSAYSRIVLFLLLGVALYLPAKWSLLQAKSDSDITVGSKNFTESRILAEIYALALEKAGYRVCRRFDLGGTLIAHAALQKGEIDVYPEYTGTGLISVLKTAPQKNETSALAVLSREYHRRWHLRWLRPADANNSQGLVVTRATAERHHLYNMSRLAELAPSLTLAAIPEFEDREDGLKGLRKTYGKLAFKRVQQYDNGLKYRVLSAQKADVAVGFTTDGELTDPALTLLEDDRRFWPQYRVAPVVKESTLQDYPTSEAVLNSVSALLDTQTLRQLNADVDLEKQDYRDVAAAFVENRLKRWETR